MIMLYIMPLFIGTTELMLIAGIALLLFGGKKLPELMKGLGQGVQSFKKGMNEPISDEENKEQEGNQEPTVGKEEKQEDESPKQK